MKLQHVKSHIKLVVRDCYWSLFGKINSLDNRFSCNKRLIFVCKGNVCRSPFAEYFARNYLKGRSDIEIMSAGYSVTEANPTPIEGVQVAKQYGIDLTEHRSRQLTNEMLVDSSIVVFEAKHIKMIEKIFPKVKKNIFLLPGLQDKAANSTPYDLFNISDPYGKNEEAFADCYKRISWCIDILFNKLDQ